MSAAFLLFPETIEIDPNSRRRRSVEAVEDSTLTPGLLTSGLCSPASSRLCKLLERVLLSIVSRVMRLLLDADVTGRRWYRTLLSPSFNLVAVECGVCDGDTQLHASSDHQFS